VRRGRTAGRRALSAVLVVALVAVAVVLASGPRSSSADDAGGPVPAALPMLGALDGAGVLMGAATAGEAGEAWAYRLLPLDVPQLPSEGGRRDFGPPRSDDAPGSQLAFLEYTDARGAWTVAETPVDGDGRPYRGFDPNRRSAQITPKGGGVLVGSDAQRTGSPVTVLARDPGDRFRVLDAPPDTVLEPGEVLSTNNGTGRVAVAAFDGQQDHTVAFFGALGPNAEHAVVRWDGTAWSREDVAVPAASAASFRIVALGATSLTNAWMLAQTDETSGDGITLLHRTVTGGTASWEPVDLAATAAGTPFSRAANAGLGISAVAALDGNAQSLTVTPDGVWVDGEVTDGRGDHDLSLYVDASTAHVTSSWCDAETGAGDALCAHPLGFSFGRRAGYRSFAFTGEGVGSRVVTNPLDPGDDPDTNAGTYVRFDGVQVRRMPGGGGNGRASAAFSSPDRGWLEGPVQIGAPAAPHALVNWPVAARVPFLAVAGEPGKPAGDPGARAIAVGVDGGVARFVPGSGWTREFLLTGSGAVSFPTLRSVAWPETGRAYAVGDTGAMWLWRDETQLWEKDQAVPLGFDGNLLGVAFDPTDPSRGYAVGRQGVLLRYDKTWTEEPLPDGVAATTDFSSIAFAGSQALVAAGPDLLVNDGTGWKVDPQVHELLRSVRAGQPQLLTVSGLPDGGAVAAGRDIVLERDGASSAWRISDDPIPGQTAVAAAAFRDGERVRAVVSVVPDLQYPPQLELPPTDENVPPPIVPPTPPPGDGYLLRETAQGWRDEQRTAFAGTTSDRPLKSDPVGALLLGAGGTGWAVGGWTGQADSAGRGSSVSGGAGTSVRRNVGTAAIYRYDPAGGDATAPGATGAPVAMPAGVTTFAVAGHAQCESLCAILANQGLGPDRNLAAALGEISTLARQPNGPKAVLYTGGRTKPGVGQTALEGQRYAQLLGASNGVPVYPAMSAGDDADVFEGVFSAFPAPFGTGPAPSGISVGAVPPSTGQASGRAATHYAFDTTGDGPVRVIVIDNSSGSLDDAQSHQNPAESQADWLKATLADAKQRGLPAIVVGSRDLNSKFTPAINVASDADLEAQILRDGGASAYLFERPEENRTSTIPSGDPNGIPEFGTGTLGYRSALTNTTQPDQPDALFGDTGYLLVSVDGAKRDPATNRAPVTARLIPLIQDLTLNAVDGTLLRRSRPALFQGIGRRPLAGDRWGAAAADGSPNPPGSNPYVQVPPDQCNQANCDSRILPEFTFSSSKPDIAGFVQQDPNSTNLRKPLQGTDAKPIASATNGLLCPYNAGKTTVTVSTGGFAYSQEITVLGGAVEQPCGTQRLSPENLPPKTTPVTVPPTTAPATIAPSDAAPPPPPPPAAPVVPAKVEPKKEPKKKAAAKPAPKLQLPPPYIAAAAIPVVGKLAKGGFVGTPPPPASPAISRPTPPGGATVRVFEQKREEEVAPEQSSAYAAYHPDEHSGLPSGFLYGIALIAALAGASITLGARRRDPRHEAVIASARIDENPHTHSRRQTRRRS